jgi:hypothetical protein
VTWARNFDIVSPLASGETKLFRAPSWGLTDGSKQIVILPHDPNRNLGLQAWWNPATTRIFDPFKARLILEY